MKILVLMVIVVAGAEALDCGIGLLGAQSKQAIEECVADKATLEKIWTSMSSEDSSMSSDEPNLKPSKRGRRAANKRRFNNNNDPSMNTVQKATTTMEPELEETTSIEYNCTSHCLFQRWEVADDDGKPDHKKLASALTKSTSSRQVKDFIQDTLDECFQMMDTSLDHCDYSSKLLMCLAEKGKGNCDDWPVVDLTSM